ncbi:MAG TPA: MarR family transcriptional regulator [Trebonia sp.]|nr:MarR family transcriptional regulator [Trebonia sp.]
MSISSTDGPGGAPGYELPLLLLAGFRAVIDEAHAELAARGHPGLRPGHAFALQAVGTFGATAADVGRRLGVSKQAAGKTIDRLAELGYVTRAGGDGSDRRRKLIRLTDRGREALAMSAEAFDRVRDRWAADLGRDRVAALETDLRAVASGQPLRLDLPGWLSS